MKRDGLGQPIDPTAHYFLAENGPTNGHCMSWRHRGNGWTRDLNDADAFFGSEAVLGDTWTPWPTDYVIARMVMHVRRDRLLEGVLQSQEPRAVIKRVAMRLNATREQVYGPSRIAVVVRARHACMLALRRRGMTFVQIGKELGGMDHTGVINGCKRAQDREATDPVFAGALAAEAPPAMLG